MYRVCKLLRAIVESPKVFDPEEIERNQQLGPGEGRLHVPAAARINHEAAPVADVAKRRCSHAA